MMFDSNELAAAIRDGDAVLPGPPGPLSTDSRRIHEGDWFLALVGERFDGHDFLAHAAASGCAGVVAERVPDGWTRGFVETGDTLVALQDIARSARRDFDGPVVGITGTAGKTTTRAMTALAIGALGRVHATVGNLNNHIGVPLTLVDAPVDAAAWVVEMGMSGFGEIDLLQEISKPTVRLITNVGAAHLEGVGSIDGVARAKGELFAGAVPGDVCCINLDDARVAALPLPEGVRRITYGCHPDAQVRLTDATLDGKRLCTRFRVETPHGPVLGVIDVPGLHLAHNAAAAVAVAVALHLDPEDAARRVATYRPVGMRQRLETLDNGVRVLNDAYNANPVSVRASLDTLAALHGVARVALLGDMLELGPTEDDLHEDVLRHALSLSLDGLGVCGPRFRRAADRIGATVVVGDSAEELGRSMGAQLAQDAVVLVKGSRGIRMERAIPLLAPRHAAPQDS